MCSKCNKPIERKDGRIKCVKCDDLYHLKCAEVTSREAKECRENWECPECTGNSETEEEEDEPGTSKNQGGIKPKYSIDSLANLMQENSKEMKSTLKEIKKSQTFISKQYDDIIARLDCITEMKQQIQQLEIENARKGAIIQDLSCRLVKLEQYSRNATFEIREVVKVENENIDQIVVNIAKSLDIEITPVEIQAAHRIPTKPGKTPPIIVQLSNRRKRDEILDCKKRLSISDVYPHSKSSQRIYIGESIAPFYRDLLWKAQQALKPQYKYVWFKKNSVLARRDDGAPILKIQCEEDIAKMVNNAQQRALNRLS